LLPVITEIPWDPVSWPGTAGTIRRLSRPKPTRADGVQGAGIRRFLQGQIAVTDNVIRSRVNCHLFYGSSAQHRVDAYGAPAHKPGNPVSASGADVALDDRVDEIQFRGEIIAQP